MRCVPAAARSTWCEFKGRACYLDVVGGGRRRRGGGVDLPRARPATRPCATTSPSTPAASTRWLDDERVEAQAGDFYGGWITADLVGPFKGPAGTLAW